MRVSPRDDGGSPSRFGTAIQVLDGATKVAGLIHGIYTAGKVLGPLVL